MKKLILPLSVIVLIISFIIIDSCNKDNQVKIDPLVGKYIISSAKLSGPLTFQGDTLLPSETDMTAAINAALLSSASCTNMTDTRLELKNNGQIWYLCEGENKGIQNGTWNVNDSRTELTLTLNIPMDTSTVTVPLKITDISESQTKVSGTTTIPLTPEFFLPFGINLPSGVTVQLTKMRIEITRMP